MTGFEVVVVISNLDGDSRCVWKELKISPTNSFTNLFGGSCQVLVFVDVLNLLK